ncbi:triacylglycerol lipase [Dorcoceras hygrometricum]|uniref:Triacylglycerol lipase n=1 Tax=Dorcoceras hygrometricum TaxID=472368 RepID=A0A2Z7A9U3_9LAMI|nr:triacylglycerol lipase [Dorcoceras hygrometricum]
MQFISRLVALSSFLQDHSFCTTLETLAAVDSSIRSTTGRETPSSACTRRPDEISADGFYSKCWPEQLRRGAAARGGGGGLERREAAKNPPPMLNTLSSVSMRESRIQYLCDPQWFRDTASRIIDSACKNQLVVVSVQYGPFNPYIPIRSMTIGKSRVAKDPIAMHTSWRSNSDITSVTRVSMTFRVVRTNQYNQDLGLIHSTNGNHLESPNEGSSIDHQVTIYLHAQNITMFPTNETWYFASQILVSSSVAQSIRN